MYYREVVGGTSDDLAMLDYLIQNGDTTTKQWKSGVLNQDDNDNKYAVYTQIKNIADKKPASSPQEIVEEVVELDWNAVDTTDLGFDIEIVDESTT